MRGRYKYIIFFKCEKGGNLGFGKIEHTRVQKITSTLQLNEIEKEIQLAFEMDRVQVENFVQVK